MISAIKQMKFQLFIIDYHCKNSSGLSTYVHQLSKSLQVFENISLSFIGVNANIDAKAVKQNINGVDHFLYLGELGVKSDSNKDFISLLKQHIKTNENIIFHFNWINHAPFAQLLKNNFDCLTVLTKHCIPWRDNITNNYKLFKTINKKLTTINFPIFHSCLHREYIAYSSVDHIITVTDFASHAVNKIFNITEDNLSRVYNGIDLFERKNNKKSQSYLKRYYGFNPDDVIILFAGNLNQRKGIYDLIEAFGLVLKKFNQVRLVIAGTGITDNIFKGLKRYLSKITFLGNLDKKILYDFYQLADVGVVPSYIEQCSYSAIEMMQAKLPLIVSDVDGLREIVPNDCGLKVPLLLKQNEAKIDVKKLSESIITLLESPSKRVNMTQRAFKFAQTNFSTDHMIEGTVAVYNKIISRRKLSSSNLLDSNCTVCIDVIICLERTAEDNMLVLQNVLKQSHSLIMIKLLISKEAFRDSKRLFKQIVNNDNIQIYLYQDQRERINLLNDLTCSSSSEYLSIIDKKCEFDEERFNKQVKILESNRNIQFVGSHHFLLDKDGYKIALSQFPIKINEGKILNVFQPSYEITNVLFRSECFINCKIDFLIDQINQIHFWFNFLKNFKGYNLNEFLTSIYPVVREKGDIEVIKELTAENIIDELEYSKLDFDSKELSLHLAIYLNYKKLFFNTESKIDRLDHWIDKILKNKLPNKSILYKSQIKSYVKKYYCEVES